LQRTRDELHADLLGGDIEVEPRPLEAPEWYLPKDGPLKLERVLDKYMRQDTGIQELSVCYFSKIR
jgi:hypothetical protein